MSAEQTPVVPPPLGAVITVPRQETLGPVPGDIVGARRHHTVVEIIPKTRKVMSRIGPLPNRPIPNNFAIPAEHEYIYWGSAWDPATENVWAHNAHVTVGEYLPYPPFDGIPIASSPDPVNQFAIGPKWQNVLSRFAHDVIAFNPAASHLRDVGTHTTGHLPPSDAAAALKNKATFQLSRAVIGVAFHRVEKWLSFDAEMLARYPTTVPDSQNWLIWQDGTIPVAEDEIPIPNMNEMMAMLCGDEVKELAGMCVGAWVYTLSDRIDASSYDSNMNSGGEIRLPNPVWDLWRPDRYLHRVTGSRSEKSDQWAEIMGWFRDAHDHYLASVAPASEHA